MQESVGSTLLPWQKKVKGQLHTYELSSESRLRPTLYETFLELLIFSFDPFRLSVLSAIFYSRSSSVNDLQTHLHLGIDFWGQHLNYTLLLITLNVSVNKRKCQRRNQQGPGPKIENLRKKQRWHLWFKWRRNEHPQGDSVLIRKSAMAAKWSDQKSSEVSGSIG